MELKEFEGISLEYVTVGEFKNPFNGIERYRVCIVPEIIDNTDRIHSMELKVDHFQRSQYI